MNHNRNIDMNARPFTLITIAALLATSGHCGAQSFWNGSFEEVTPGAYINGPGDRMIDTPAEQWTTESGSVDWFFAPGITLWDTNWGEYLQHAGAGLGPFAPVGGSLTDALFISGPSREGISQIVSGFTPGDDYTLSYNHANGFFLPNALAFGEIGGWEVFLDDVSIAQSLSTNDNTSAVFPFTTDWNGSSVNFQATAATHKFTFLAYKLNPFGQSSHQWLDNVALNPVPEPATAALFVLVGLAASRRR